MNISNTTYNPFGFGFQVTPSTSPAVQKASAPANLTPGTTHINTGEVQQSKGPGGQVAPAGESEQNKTGTNSQDNSPVSSESTRTINGEHLTPEELRLLEQLKLTDAEVRRHEMAHVAAGGRYITSGASFTYQRGPDGRNYAVGGEVSIDTSAIPGDPEATLQKMRQVKNAALAPANPSAQDMKVAAKATAAASKALADLMILQAEEQAQRDQAQAFDNSQNASDQYRHVQGLPESDTHTFQIAV